jgi:hypothetical protein
VIRAKPLRPWVPTTTSSAPTVWARHDRGLGTTIDDGGPALDGELAESVLQPERSCRTKTLEPVERNRRRSLEIRHHGCRGTSRRIDADVYGVNEVQRRSPAACLVCGGIQCRQ